MHSDEDFTVVEYYLKMQRNGNAIYSTSDSDETQYLWTFFVIKITKL